MHFFIIFLIIAIIVFYQFRIYKETIEKIDSFKDIFAHSQNNYTFKSQQQFEESINSADEEELMTMLRDAGLDVADFISRRRDDGIYSYSTFFDTSLAQKALIKDGSLKGISSKHYNPVFYEIKNAINNYLSNNKGSVSDFHLMKDIVDRNCDAKEEEINTQIPVPLYLGLMGTMIGILVGIFYLWLSGDLSALLSVEKGQNGANGVEALLGGVALAMISSICGILLTTRGSMKAKEAKATEEKYKHVFLSWMQATLLPSLSNDTAQTLERMSSNLVKFNNTFSKNTKELGVALSQVNETTRQQSRLMQLVENVADKDITRQNLEVYNALKNCSAEIGTLANYLNHSNDYLVAVRELNEKLDKNEERSKALEKMAAFFENETRQIELRKAAMSKAVGEVDSRLEETFRKLTKHAIDNVEIFQAALGKQQDALQRKLDETQVIVDELKNLSSIKASIAKFERATNEQNQRIDRLTGYIKFLAEAKSGTGRINLKIPKVMSVGIVCMGTIVLITCIIIIIKVL